MHPLMTVRSDKFAVRGGVLVACRYELPSGLVLRDALVDVSKLRVVSRKTERALDFVLRDVERSSTGAVVYWEFRAVDEGRGIILRVLNEVGPVRRIGAFTS